MKLALMSDSHDNFPVLAKAIEIAEQAGCEMLLFAGDLISPPGIDVLAKFSGNSIVIWGNNENEKPGIIRKVAAAENVELSEGYYEGEMGGLKIFMNHYPRYTELAAASGQFDVCIHGHTHEYREEKVGETLLLNPGEIMGYLSGTSTFMILDTETKQVTKQVVE